MGGINSNPDPACLINASLDDTEIPVICIEFSQVTVPFVTNVDRLLGVIDGATVAPVLHVSVTCFENTCPDFTYGNPCTYEECTSPVPGFNFADADRQKSKTRDVNFTMGMSTITNITLPLYSIAIRLSWLVGGMLEPTFVPTTPTTTRPISTDTPTGASTATETSNGSTTTMEGPTKSNKVVHANDDTDGAAVVAGAIVGATAVVLLVAVVVVIAVRKRLLSQKDSSSTTPPNVVDTPGIEAFQSFRADNEYSASPQDLAAMTTASAASVAHACLVCNKAYPTAEDLSLHNAKRHGASLDTRDGAVFRAPYLTVPSRLQQ